MIKDNNRLLLLLHFLLGLNCKMVDDKGHKDITEVCKNFLPINVCMCLQCALLGRGLDVGRRVYTICKKL